MLRQLGHPDALRAHWNNSPPRRLVGFFGPAGLLALAAFQIALLLKYSVKIADYCPTGFFIQQQIHWVTLVRENYFRQRIDTRLASFSAFLVVCT